MRLGPGTVANGGPEWISASGIVHHADTADNFLLLMHEWPRLPSGPLARLGQPLPATQRVSRDELLAYRSSFLTSVTYVNRWISIVESNPGTIQEANEEVARAALAYYEEQYVDMSLFHGEYFTELWEYVYGQTSLRTSLFFELCRLRVIIREAFGPRWHQDGHPQDWAWLHQQHLTIQKSKCVGLFTMREMEQAFTLLFRYWKSMPYTDEVATYTGRLLDKQASFFCSSGTEGEMNVPLYRTALRTGAGAEDNLSSQWFGPTLSFTFKCQLRYFNIMSSILLTRGRRRACADTLHLPPALPYPYHMLHSSTIYNLAENKASRIRKEMHEAVREGLLADLLHPGDFEWLAFLRPVAQLTNQMVIDLFHSEEDARIHRESRVTPSEVLKLDGGGPRAGSKSRVVIDLVDKMLPYHLRFLSNYVIARADLVRKLDLLLTSDRPLLVQFFGHYELYWLGTVYTTHDQQALARQGRTYTTQSIYDTIHLWLRIMAYHPAFRHTWEETVEEGLDEWIQTLYYLKFRGSGLHEETATTQARNVWRSHKERRHLAEQELVGAPEDPELDEIDRMFAEGDEVGGAADPVAPDAITDPTHVSNHILLSEADIASVRSPVLTFYK